MGDKKSVLVTGGLGFIGSHIVDALVETEDYHVFCLDSSGNADVVFRNPECAYTRGSICDRVFLHSFFYHLRPDYVIHCAANARIQPSYINPCGYAEANAQGTANILEMARVYGVKKVVYSSSSCLYGNATKMPLKETFRPRPLNPYGTSKLMGEMWVKEYARSFGVPACSLRYFNVYGERQPSVGEYATIVGIFLRQLEEAKKEGRVPEFTIVPPGTQRRDFTWVGDVAKANMLAMLSGNETNGQVFNIGTQKDMSIDDLAHLIGDGCRHYVLKPIGKRPGEAMLSVADNSKAEEMLGWTPEVTIEEGVKRLKNKFQKA